MKTIKYSLLLVMVLFSASIFAQDDKDHLTLRLQSPGKRSMPTVYRDSGSEIVFEFHGKPQPTRPFTIQATPAGTVVRMLDENRLMIVATERKVSFGIYGKEGLLATENFDVKSPPALREVKVLVDDRPYDETKGIPKGTSILKIVPVVDETYKEVCPKDSNFRITGLTLQITARNKTLVVTSGTIDLKAYNLRVGEEILLHSFTVVRRNWNNETVPVECKLTRTFKVGN